MATEENIRHPAIKRANARSSSDLQQFISLIQSVKDVSYVFRVLFASELQKAMREEIWRIFEHNMESQYQTSSFGWNPDAKQEEIFHPLARLILVWPENKDPEPQNLLAYTIFRFEREDRRNVVYCYEIETKESAQRLGLGKALMSNLEEIGRGLGLTDIMLTVFTANVKALSFYDSQGFTVDRTSPDYEGSDEEQDEEEDEEDDADNIVDYRILSRHIRKTRE